MAAQGLDDFKLAQRLAPRPWADRPLDLDEERERIRSVEAWKVNVRRWRLGKTEPRHAQLRLIAAALDVSVEALIPKEEA